jgi:DNA polymerase III epsilon subunit-like protein
VVKNITGIKEEELLLAPTWMEVKQRILEFMGDENVILIGHNVAFDLSFLKNNGLDFEKNKVIDSWYIASMLIFDIESYSLETLADYVKWKYRAHRALDDAEAVMVLFQYLLNQIDNVPLVVMKRIEKIITKGDWDYKLIFADRVANDQNRVEKLKTKLSISKCEQPIDSNCKFILKEINLEETLSINKTTENSVLILSDYNFARVKNKYQVGCFDSRSKYICKSALKELMKTDNLDKNLIGILVKILLRTTRGYWDGYVWDINWSMEEKKSLNRICCFKYKCNDDCFVDDRWKLTIQNKNSIVVTYNFSEEMH